MAKPKETDSPEETLKFLKKRGVSVQEYQNSPLQGVLDEVQATISGKLLLQSLEIANWPDIDLNDAVAVQERVNRYFTLVATNGNKPTVAGLALSLNGMDRRRLWEIRTGNFGNQHRQGEVLPKEVRDVLKKAYKTMEDLWENYMQNGLINPVSGIFLGKNNYGYQDKTEYVVTPNVKDESDYNEQEIRERYNIPSANPKLLDE